MINDNEIECTVPPISSMEHVINNFAFIKVRLDLMVLFG